MCPKQAGTIDEAVAARVLELFEKHGARAGYREAILEGLEAQMSNATLSRYLRHLRLKRGRLTPRQVLICLGPAWPC